MPHEYPSALRQQERDGSPIPTCRQSDLGDSGSGQGNTNRKAECDSPALFRHRNYRNARTMRHFNGAMEIHSNDAGTKITVILPVSTTDSAESENAPPSGPARSIGRSIKLVLASASPRDSGSLLPSSEAKSIVRRNPTARAHNHFPTRSSENEQPS
jgi:hypothetical protein